MRIKTIRRPGWSPLLLPTEIPLVTLPSSSFCFKAHVPLFDCYGEGNTLATQSFLKTVCLGCNQTVKPRKREIGSRLTTFRFRLNQRIVKVLHDFNLFGSVSTCECRPRTGDCFLLNSGPDCRSRIASFFATLYRASPKIAKSGVPRG